jgi:hypothetical protein
MNFYRFAKLECRQQNSFGDWEVSMRVWVGLKQGEDYVHEWVGEVSDDEDIADAVKNAITDYRKASGKEIWGMTIMVDKNPPPGTD